MSSTEAAAEDRPALDGSTTDVRPKPVNRSLFTYFGGRPRSDVPNPEASGDERSDGQAQDLPSGSSVKQPPRKRRKKVDEGQSRLLKAEGGGWALGKLPAKQDTQSGAEEEDDRDPTGAGPVAAGPANTAKRKEGRKKGTGEEEEEVRDMVAARKTRRTMAKRGRRKGQMNGRSEGVRDGNGTERSMSRSASPTKGHKSNGAQGDDERRIIHLSSDGPEEDAANTYSGNHHIPKPFLAISRATSVSSRGTTHHDAIDIDDEPLEHDDPIVLKVQQKQPRKLVFAADQKATHSFFNRGQPLLATTSEPTLARPDDEVQAEMAKSTSAQGKVKKAAAAVSHPFFSAAGRPEVGRIKNGWGGGVKEGEEWTVPLPGRIWPGHVGVSKPGEASTSQLKRRPVQTPKSVTEQDWSFSTVHRQRSTPAPGPPDVPPSVQHMAILSVRKRETGPNRASWCEKYRPLSARQVLGNEKESVYMRDWLNALAVRHEQRIKITRRVPRARSDLVDGWIVDDIGSFSDEEEDEEDGEEDGERFETIYEAPLPFDDRPAAYPSFHSRLANTMLLTGPHGCGKSAAVYAAAEELGWEVFEVYPGIGKRTGGALMNLVGDVGKNHIVAQSKSPSKAKSSIGPFFGKQGNGNGNGNGARSKKDDEDVIFLSSSQGSQKDPIDFLSDPQDDTSKGFKQSLILLDEVDLLYEEESTFRPAVVSLIAESRRPIILTCNDPERLPIASLPLQAILQFRPAPPTLAIPYLSAIAQHENLGLADRQVAKLYQASMLSPPDLLDQALPPNGHEVMPLFDLRRAIAQMQLERSATSHLSIGNGNSGESDEDFCTVKKLARVLDCQSYVDAFVEPEAAHLIEVTEIDRYKPTPDDMLGVFALRKPEYDDRHPVLASIATDCAQAMADEIRYLATASYGAVPSSTITTDRAHAMTDEIQHSATASYGAVSSTTIATDRDHASADEAQHLATSSYGASSSSSTSDLRDNRTQYMRSLLPLLDPLIPLGAPLLPSSCLFTDYLPIIRTIVIADDALQAADQAADARGEERINRKTGRPVRITDALKREEYRRYFAAAGVSIEGENVVRNMTIG